MELTNPVVTRYPRNPILTREDVPYPVATVHNAGMIKHDGRYIMLFRAHLMNGRSVIGKAVRDGRKWYYIDDGLYGSFSGRLFDQCSYQILTNRNTKWEKAVLAGPTCDSFDVIYRDCLMPPLDIGGILIFPTMGAGCSGNSLRPSTKIGNPALGTPAAPPGHLSARTSR